MTKIRNYFKETPGEDIIIDITMVILATSLAVVLSIALYLMSR